MYKRILVVVGDRVADRAAVKEGVALAKVHGAAVVLFYVLPKYIVPLVDMSALPMGQDEFQRDAHSNGQRMLDAARMVAEKSGVHCTGLLGTGVDDAECIADAAKKHRCGLVVVATEGRNAIMRLLSGSVIPGLITLSTVPVLVCRSGAPQGAAARGAARSLKPRGARRAIPARAT